jgi:hypothetical protein
LPVSFFKVLNTCYSLDKVISYFILVLLGMFLDQSFELTVSLNHVNQDFIYHLDTKIHDTTLSDVSSSNSDYVSRQNVLEIMDGFIESMTKMRKLFVGFSASALFLAPIAIVLVIYLIFHPLFLSVLENYGDFGILLSILLVSVIIISGTWFVLGLRQYRTISSWNKRHIRYIRMKEDMQKAFTSQFEIGDTRS